ncbi:S-layer homology domain-containing protein [Paenibacillus sp. JSM ZJ436]|uniref:S-layer homology domain-containing protein n=1 Tax=Paenibacillus sp. JSM ZJ436 TaxID=3376190 RepID=UPI0037ACFFBD
MRNWVAALVMVTFGAACLPPAAHSSALLPEAGAVSAPLQAVSQASTLTLEAPAQAAAGKELVFTGGSHSSDVILTVRNTAGEILYFDTVKTSSNQYRSAITVPAAWASGSYEVSAASGGSRVTRPLTILASSPQNPNNPDTGSPGGSTGSPVQPGSPSPSPILPGQTGVSPDGAKVFLQVPGSQVSGVTKAVVSGDQMKSLIELWKQDAGSPSKKRMLELQLSAGAASANRVSLELPEGTAALLSGSGIPHLSITTPLAQLSMDTKVIQAFQTQVRGAMQIEVSKIETAAMPVLVKTVTGNRPVLDLSIRHEGGTVADFGGGTVKVSIPYSAAAGEARDALVVYHIAENGTLTAVPNGWLDSTNGMYTFAVKHFSIYGIGYNKQEFRDVSGWSQSYVTYLAARGLVQGYGADRFQPGSSMTRAEFLSVLARMSGDSLSIAGEQPFKDVNASHWYADIIHWASREGIALGKGPDTFKPHDLITREELAVMLGRYVRHIEYELPVPDAEGSLESFRDRSAISAWAQADVEQLQRAGMIQGTPGGLFQPKAAASREEAAKLLALLLQGMSK